MFDEEVWKAIPEFENYEASNYGRIRSLERYILRTTPRDSSKMYYKKYGGKILKQSVAKSLYNMENRYPIFSFVTPRKDNKTFTRSVGPLILETFVGPRPENYDCCHFDGDPTNNKLSNLRWDTKKSNAQDRIRHGRKISSFVKGSNRADGSKFIGEQVYSAKLKENEVLEIRKVESYRGINMDLARKYNVSKSCIQAIRHRRIWKHI